MTEISVRDIHEWFSVYPTCSIAHKKSKNEHTFPLYDGYRDGNTISDSLELQAEDTFMGMYDVNKPMDALSYLQNNVSTVFDNPCCHIKKAVSQCLDELFLIYAGQCQPLDPVDNVICQHSDSHICPVCMELLTGKPVKGKTIFCFSNKVLHGCPLKVKRNKVFYSFSSIGDNKKRDGSILSLPSLFICFGSNIFPTLL